MKTINLRLYLFATAFIALFCLSNHMLAQGIPAKTAVERMAVDNVADKLQKYGGNDEISVGAGGDLGLAVPIYEVKGRRLSLPLQLSYHPGIKVEQKASDVGLGWSIDFGRIRRDFGAYDPDYADVGRNEVGSGNEKLGGGMLLNSQGSATAFNPNQNEGMSLKRDGLEDNQVMPDDYHVSLPGVGGGTFWNNGATTHDWKWSEHKNWLVKQEVYDFRFDQEFSRVNEVNFPNSETKSQWQAGYGSYAAAITIPDYVTHHYSAKTVLVEDATFANLNDVLATNARYIQYQDYKGFTLIDENGTQYVFNKPLRAQRFVFGENPYWSTMTERQRDEFGPATTNFPSDASLGEGWKQEYIAEWCLTAVRSHDYVDANNDGQANDGDLGDWIRIEYDREFWTATGEDPSSLEWKSIPGTNSGVGRNYYPYYREYDGYSQTDMASSVWRELAYVRRVVTPVQVLEVEFSPRMEVDHDYYGQMANRRYQEAFRTQQSPGNWAGFEDLLKIEYPNRTQKYTGFELYDRVSGADVATGGPTARRMIGRTSLEYAAQGSPQELCVSSYLIRDNSDMEGNLVNPASPVRAVGRGKTTLKAVVVQGDLSSPQPIEQHRYEFDYGYNPDFTSIHRAMMWGELYFPSKRESYGRGNWKGAGEFLYNMNYFTTLEPYNVAANAAHYVHDLHIGATVAWPYFEDFIVPSSPYFSNAGMEQRVNSSGYHWDAYRPDRGLPAWSLTEIRYPTGGKASLSYQPDVIDLTKDSNWGIRPDELKNTQVPFNRYVVRKEASQAIANALGCMAKPKTTSSPFHFPLDIYGSGIRTARIEVQDGVGSTYPRTFTYGSGVLTRMPADYWHAFSSAFSKHIRIQKAKQLHDNYCPGLIGLPTGHTDGDFDIYDQYFTAQFRVDKNQDHEVVYEKVWETYADGSMVGKTYRTTPTNTSVSEERIAKNLQDLTRDLHVIAGNPLYGIGQLQKLERYQAGSIYPYASEQYGYGYAPLLSKSLRYKANASSPMQSTVDAIIYGTTGCISLPSCTNSYWFVATAFDPCESEDLYTLLPTPVEITRSLSLAVTLDTKITTYEGLATEERYTYVPGSYQLRSRRVANSSPLTGVQDVRAQQTKYAWEHYTGPELARIRERNLISWVLSEQSYGTNSMASTTWPNSELTSAVYSTIDYRDLPMYSSYQIYPGKRYAFVTDQVDAVHGWIQGYTLFTPPAFVTGNSPANAPEWTEVDAVAVQRDDYGNPTWFDSPYRAGRLVYGMNRSLPIARFENTGGLDASYIGYEDASPSDDGNNPNAIVLGDGWVASPNPGAIDNSLAHTGGASYKLLPGTESYVRTFSLTPLVHYASNQAQPSSGVYDYVVSLWVYATAAGTVEIVVQPGSAAPVSFSHALAQADVGRWVQVVRPLQPAASLGTFGVKARNSSGAATLYVDDMLVYPVGAEYGFAVHDHRRQPTWQVGFNDVPFRTAYDHLGRVREEYDGNGDLLASYQYKVSGNLSQENSYIEVARYVDASRVGISRVYLDGLGRSKQTIAWEPSNLRGIITQTTDYDVMGRPYRKWNPLPLPGLQAGLPSRIVGNYSQRALQFYSSNYAYTATEYDQSPDPRPLRAYHPRLNGQANLHVRYEYHVNTAAIAGYGAGELLEVVKIDEDGFRFTEYLDKLGNKVCATQPLDGGMVDLPLGGVTMLNGTLQYALTRWTLDQSGRIRTVTNPEGQVTNFQYSSRGDVLQESHPDRGITQFRYDRHGRLRLVMDANMAGAAIHPDPQVNCSTGTCLQFKYLKYDRMDRPTEEGLLFTTNPAHFSDRAFRDDQAFPGAGLAYQPRIQNGYDSPAALERGLLTTQKVHHAFTFTTQGSVFTPTVTDGLAFGHDANGRITSTAYTLDGLVGTHDVRLRYNRQGQVTDETYVNAVQNKEYYRRDVHDDHGRQVASYSGYNDLAQLLTYNHLDSRHAYDDVGRLYRKHIGATGNSSAPWLAQVELGHDIRSRLTRITSDRLKIELQYDRRGNIQTQRWQNGQFDSDPVLWNYYRYHYDRDYRLVAADYSQVRYTCGPSTERLGGLGEEPFVKKGTQVYAAAKDQAADPPYTGKEQYARHPQVDDLDYAADPELLQALVEAMGAGAFEGFTPAYRYGGVDFLASVVQADSTWRTAQQLDLSQGTGQPCPAVIEPSDRYDCWYRYDRIGNITRLKRKQLAPTGSFAMNWMDYSYPAGLVSSRLSKVGDVNSLYSTKYTYDPNGNITSDLAPNITGISYDWRNRPVEMAAGSRTYTYRYDAGGLRSYRKVVTGAGAPREEYFVGGMVLSPSGALLRLDISEGFAEIAQNGAMKRSVALKDWLGTARVTLDGGGAVAQAADYDPYGRAMDLRSFAAGVEADRYRFTGHEHDGESGYDYHGARYYQAEVGRYLGVDVMAVKYAGWTSYKYALNNPVMLLDTNGKSESTWVTKNEDGTYRVFGGDIEDGSNAIILFENGQAISVIGYSATPESFYFAEKETWQGTIRTWDQSGRRFLNDQILSGNPSLPNYMYNATGGKPYDFKRTNGTETSYFNTRADHYRGMPILGEQYGKPIYASARDIGNIGAGIVAGRSGLSWNKARLGFDALESYQQGELASESTSTQYAQKLGWRIGEAIYIKTELSRIPGNGHLLNTEIPNGPIKRGEL